MHYCKLFIIKTTDIDEATKEVTTFMDENTYEGSDTTDWWVFGGRWEGTFKEYSVGDIGPLSYCAPLMKVVSILEECKQSDMEQFDSLRNILLRDLKDCKLGDMGTAYALKRLSDLVYKGFSNEIRVFNLNTFIANDIPSANLDQYSVIIVDNHN